MRLVSEFSGPSLSCPIGLSRTNPSAIPEGVLAQRTLELSGSWSSISVSFHYLCSSPPNPLFWPHPGEILKPSFVRSRGLLQPAPSILRWGQTQPSVLRPGCPSLQPGLTLSPTPRLQPCLVPSGEWQGACCQGVGARGQEGSSWKAELTPRAAAQPQGSVWEAAARSFPSPTPGR